MKKILYTLPHVVTLVGLGFAGLAAMALISSRYDQTARWCLLVLAVDRVDGTLARAMKTKDRFPNTSGEILDIITDLVGLTFVPMLLFYKSGLFIEGTGLWLVMGASAAASWKYSRKEGFLAGGYSVGAPPIFFSLFLFYFLDLPQLAATIYAAALIGLVVSPIKYPITSLVTTHWRPGFKSITNWLTALFFIPVYILLHNAPPAIYWIMLTAIVVQLTIYPLLLSVGLIAPVFDRSR
jgi:phosphatidylcholine synthase